MGILPIMIIVGLLTGAQCTSVNLTTDAPTTAFPTGRTVKLTCQGVLTNFDILSIRKDVLNSNSPIAINQVVEDEFRKTGRYDVKYTYTQETSVGEMELTITNFNMADAGTYFCRLSTQSKEKQSQMRDIIVQVPVDDVRMAVILPNKTTEDVADNSDVLLEFGKAGGIACIVTLKSYVNVPSVNVTINGMTSPDFVFSETRVANESAGVYEFVYKYMTSMPDYQIHGNKIECTANTGESQKQSAAVKGSATFKPVIQCKNTKLEVPLGEDVEVICTVFSNPPADISVEYGTTYTDNALELDSNRDGKFEFITTQGDLTNRTVTFKVYSITQGLFTVYKYRLKADSSLGVTITPFSFREKYISGSSLPTTSRFMTLLTFFCSLILSYKSL